MGTTTTTETKISVYTGEATKIQKQIDSYRQLLQNKDAAKIDAKKKEADNEGLAKQKDEEQKAQQIVVDKMKAMVLKEKAPLDDAKKAYDDANKEISAAVEKTKVMPSLVVDFLKLTNKIIPTVNKQNGDTQKLINSIDQVSEFLDRDCNVDARILDANVFGTSRYKRIGIVIERDLGLEYAKDIVGDKTFCDETVIPPIKQAIQDAATEYAKLIKEHKDDGDDTNIDPEFEAKKAELEKLQPNLKWIDTWDGRKIEQVVVEPRAWETEQADKIKTNYKELDIFCPIMAEFFDAAYNAIQLSLVILDINESLNAKQKIALESIQNDDAKEEDIDNKAIEAPKDNDSDDNSQENKEFEIAKQQDEEREKHQEKAMFDYTGITSIADNKELTTAIDINSKLISVVVKDLDILNSDKFKERFDKKENATAKIFAREVQIACLQMMKCQGAERGQILLAQKILSLKPANVDNEKNKFWEALDAGIAQIYKATSEINQVSLKFFNFFARLQDSFIKYTTRGQDVGPLKKDLNAFIQFKNDYGEKLEILSKQALNTIVNCIKVNIGDANVEKALKQVDDLRQKYQVALSNYNVAYANHVKQCFKEEQSLAQIKGELEKAEQLAKFYKEFAEKIDNVDKESIEKKIKELEDKLAKTKDYETVDKKIVVKS